MLAFGVKGYSEGGKRHIRQDGWVNQPNHIALLKNSEKRLVVRGLGSVMSDNSAWAYEKIGLNRQGGLVGVGERRS